MKRIVLLRHGESLWNKENRFTGWTDVDLSEKGVEEACKAGDALREAGFSFEAAYTSYLKRAVKTLNCVLDRLDEDWIPVEKTWRLNEKHYGMLQDIRYAGVPDRELPRTESLKDAIGRVMPYWECIIFPALMYKDSLLVVAHGNSLRGIIKHLKGISDTDISNLNLPTAVPYVPEEIRKRAEAVAKQGMAKK